MSSGSTTSPSFYVLYLTINLFLCGRSIFSCIYCIIPFLTINPFIFPAKNCVDGHIDARISCKLSNGNSRPDTLTCLFLPCSLCFISIINTSHFYVFLHIIYKTHLTGRNHENQLPNSLLSINNSLSACRMP